MSTDVRKVAAVVVTYNRLEKLKKVLASLESQTRLPQMLVIVNNAATDGTAEHLKEDARYVIRLVRFHAVGYCHA